MGAESLKRARLVGPIGLHELRAFLDAARSRVCLQAPLISTARQAPSATQLAANDGDGEPCLQLQRMLRFTPFVNVSLSLMPYCKQSDGC